MIKTIENKKKLVYTKNSNKTKKAKGKRIKVETLEILRERERERERELTFKPKTKENLVLFVVSKLYLKYQNLKGELCKKIHNSFSFSLHRNK